MDWKLDQQKREKNQMAVKNESAQKVNILGEMEQEFERIFGSVNSASAKKRSQTANAVMGNKDRKH